MIPTILKLKSLLSSKPNLTFIWVVSNHIPYAHHKKPRLVSFYPIFHCCLYCRTVNITNNLCTKLGNSSIFWPRICGSQSRVMSNQEQVIMAFVRYLGIISVMGVVATSFPNLRYGKEHLCYVSIYNRAASMLDGTRVPLIIDY